MNDDIRPPHEELFLVAILVESDHKPIGTFTMAVDVTDFLKTLLTPLYMPYRINFALLTRFNVVFEASDPALRFQLFKPLTPEMVDLINRSTLYDDYKLADQPLKLSPISNTPFFEFVFPNKKQLAYEISVPNSDTKLVAYVAKNAISIQILKEFIPIIVLFFLISLFGGLIVFLFTHLMAKPFFKLAACMGAAKNNDYNVRYHIDRFGFEINDLGEIFNAMLHSMSDYIRRAEEERAKREAIAQELKIGQEVQRQILPQSMPNYPKVELAECYISAKEVGGDFYDAFIQEIAGKEKLFFTIADASGSGISACLYSLGVSSLIRGFGKEIASLSMVVNRVNKNFSASSGGSGMFVTALLGTFDRLTEQLSYISCGHNPAILKRKNGEMEFLTDHGVALGFMEDLDLKEKNVLFQEGDTLIMYTNGVTDATNEKEEFFGMERLIAFCKEQNSKLTARELTQALIKKIAAFTLSSAQHDDMTLLIIKRI